MDEIGCACERDADERQHVQLTGVKTPIRGCNMHVAIDNEARQRAAPKLPRAGRY
jgi:hypothetical protein